MNKKIAILGAGTWGTALAVMLSQNNLVQVYSPIASETEYINTYHKHPNLKDARIPTSIVFTTSLQNVLANADIVVFATPSIYIRNTAKEAKQFLSKNQIIVTVAKGIELDTLFTMSEIIEDELGKGYKLVALSGPTHAEEVSLGLPTTIVSASSDEDARNVIQEVFSSKYMRVYTNDDILGVELCGAFKNVLALAAGISVGLGYGDNAKAAIITRGANELARLGKAMNCKPYTFFGLAGIGDLIVTATSMHSRNNRCGILLGKGYSVEEATKEIGMVVEGINALDAAKKLADKHNIEMPLVNAVYEIVKLNKKPKDVINSLFNRENKSEG